MNSGIRFQHILLILHPSSKHILHYNIYVNTCKLLFTWGVEENSVPNEARIETHGVWQVSQDSNLTNRKPHYWRLSLASFGRRWMREMRKQSEPKAVTWSFRSEKHYIYFFSSDGKYNESTKLGKRERKAWQRETTKKSTKSRKKENEEGRRRMEDDRRRHSIKILSADCSPFKLQAKLLLQKACENFRHWSLFVALYSYPQIGAAICYEG